MQVISMDGLEMLDSMEAAWGALPGGCDAIRPCRAVAPEGYQHGFARSRGAAPSATIDSLYDRLERAEGLLAHGTYQELDNGYLVSSDSLLPEAPKLFVYEDERGLHLQGRGDGASEDTWLDVTFADAHYFSREKSYRVTEGRAMDARRLAVYRGEDDRLHVTVSRGMLLPPIDLAFERSG